MWSLDHIVSRSVFLESFPSSWEGLWQDFLDEVLRTVLHRKSGEMVLTVLMVSVWKNVRHKSSQTILALGQKIKNLTVLTAHYP